MKTFFRAALLSALTLYSMTAMAADGPLSGPPGHIILSPPPGFVASSDFAGFVHSASGSAIQITELAGAGHYDEVAQGMTAEGLASRGMTLTGRTEVSGMPYRATMIQADQTASGVQLHKWLMVIDGPDFVGIVTLMTTKGAAAVTEDSAQATLKSVRLRPDTGGDPIAALPFTLATPPRFTYKQAMSGAGLLLRQGAPDPSSNAPGMIAVAQAIPPLNEAVWQTAATQLLKSTAAISIQTIVSERPVTIGPLRGWEIQADSKAPDGSAEKILATYLFAQNRVYQLIAMAPADRFDEAMPDFRTVIASFRPAP